MCTFSDAKTQPSSPSRSSTGRPLHTRIQFTGDSRICGSRTCTVHTQVNTMIHLYVGIYIYKRILLASA